MAEITDEEIEHIVSEFCSTLEGHRQALKEIAEHYLEKGRQEVIDWGNGWCYNEKHPRSCSWEVNHKKECSDCWAELKKEAEGG